MHTQQTYYKIFTHDWRSPLQGGDPICGATPTFPFTLPEVEVDTSPAECGKGWNFTKDLCTAARIAGYWPTGRPANCVIVQPTTLVHDRGNKSRSSGLIVSRLCTDQEIQQSMFDNVKQWAGSYTQELTNEQFLWYKALGRPVWDKSQVVKGLEESLAYKKLSWSIRDLAWDARDAWDAWDARDARDARAAWVARAARDVARAARDAWDAWVARAAWDARNAWGALAAHDAWDARDALFLYVVAVFCNFQLPKDYLTRGVREAYYHGMKAIFPIAPSVLGYTMI